MANKYRHGAGSWNDGQWYTDPTAGDLSNIADGDCAFLNGYNVVLNVSTCTLTGLYAGSTTSDATKYTGLTINASSNNCTINCPGATIQGSASGLMSVIDAITLNIVGNVLGARASSTATLTVTNASAIVNITGNVESVSTSTSGGVNIQLGTVNVTGNVLARLTDAITVGGFSSSSGTLRVTGDVTGSSSAAMHGIRVHLSSVVEILGNKNVRGGTYNGAMGIMLTQSGSLTVTGNVYGGAGAGVGCHGIYVGGTATAVINGSVTGGTNATNNLGITIVGTNNVVTVNTGAGFVKGGATTCHAIATGGTTPTLNVDGNIYGGDTASSYGISAAAGTVNVTHGNICGGAISSSGMGIALSSNAALNATITGLLTGGASSAAYGISAGGSGPVTITTSGSGQIIGSTTGLAAAINYGGSSLITINGNVYGGNSASSYGMMHQSTGKVVINGNIYGGTAPAACGIYFSSSSYFIFVYGSIYGGQGGTADATSYGIYFNNVRTRALYTGSLVTQTAAALSASQGLQFDTWTTGAGSWSDGTKWNTGQPPASNAKVNLNHNMTMDTDTVSIDSLYNIGITGQTGMLSLPSSSTKSLSLSGMAVSGGGTLISIAGNGGGACSPATITIQGALYSGAGSATAAYGISVATNFINQTAEIIARGNFVTLCASSIILGSPSATVTVRGNLTGGTVGPSASAIAINSSTNLILYGDVTGGGFGNSGISVGSTGANTVTIHGNIYGGTSSTGLAVNNTSTTLTTDTGDLIATSGASAVSFNGASWTHTGNFINTVNPALASKAPTVWTPGPQYYTSVSGIRCPQQLQAAQVLKGINHGGNVTGILAQKKEAVYA